MNEENITMHFSYSLFVLIFHEVLLYFFSVQSYVRFKSF